MALNKSSLADLLQDSTFIQAMESSILSYTLMTTDMVNQMQLRSVIGTSSTISKVPGQNISVVEGQSNATIILPDLGVNCCVWQVVDTVLLPPPPPPSPPSCSYPGISSVISKSPLIQDLSQVIASLPATYQSILTGTSGSGCTYFAPSDAGRC